MILERKKLLYNYLDENSQIFQDDYTVGKVHYGKIGLLITIGILVFGVLSWQLNTQLGMILPVKLKNLGATDGLIAFFLTSVPHILNMIINPIVSFKSDRTRSRFGRRMPYIIFSVISASISGIALGWSYEIGSLIANIFSISIEKTILNLIIFFSTLSVIFGLFIGSTIYYLFADLIPAKFFGRFMVAFQMACAFAGIIGSRIILPWANRSFNWCYTILSIVYILSYLVFVLLIKEGEYPPITQKNPKGKMLQGIKDFFIECFTIPFYYWFFVMISISEVSMACRITFNILFAQKSLGLTIDEYGKIMMYSMGLSLILSIPVGYCIDKFNALRIYLVGLILVTVVNCVGFFYVKDYRSFLVMSLVLAVVYTIQNTSALPVYVAILPKTKFGQYSAAVALFRSCIMFIGSYGGGLYIQYFSNYRHIYSWDFILTLLTIPVMLGLIHAWKKRGGEKNYIAPIITKS